MLEKVDGIFLNYTCPLCKRCSTQMKTAKYFQGSLALQHENSFLILIILVNLDQRNQHLQGTLKHHIVTLWEMCCLLSLNLYSLLV